MATYWQWRFPGRRDTTKANQVAKAYEVERITWICGDEPVLIEEMLDLIKVRLAQLHQLDTTSLDASTDPESEVWAAANQYPPSTNVIRLVTVRSAQRLKGWDKLERWVNEMRLLPNVYLVLISDEPDFAYGKRTADSRPLVPHLELIKAKGDMVRASFPPAASAADTLRQWIATFVHLEASASKHLVDRVGADIQAIRDTCFKLQCAQLKNPITEQVIDLFCIQQAKDTFVNALLKNDKRDAFLSLETMSEDDYLYTIAVLDQRLDWLSRMKNSLANGREKGAYLKGEGVNSAFIATFDEYAKYYDPVTVEACRLLLERTDHYLRSSFSKAPGAMEALVMSWRR